MIIGSNSIEQKLWLPYKFDGLNDYIAAINSNRHTGNDMKQSWTNIVALLAKRHLFSVTHPVEIDFVWFEENAKRDPDNIIFAKKFILDGLVVAGILPQDNQKWVYGFSDRWLAKPPKNSKIKMHPEIKVGVEITIKEIV